MAVDLSAGLASSSTPAGQLRCLFSLQLWLDALFANKQTGKILRVLPFVVQHLCPSLLNFIREQQEGSNNSLKSALTVLHKVLVDTLSLAPHNLNSCLLQINSGLIAVINNKKKKRNDEKHQECVGMARQLLELLLVDHLDQFRDQLDLLEDYPETGHDGCFAQLISARVEVKPSLGLKAFIKKLLHLTEAELPIQTHKKITLKLQFFLQKIPTFFVCEKLPENSPNISCCQMGY
jgi:hypothetical protein